MNNTHLLTINGVNIGLGESKTILLSMPRLYDATPLHMPVHIIRGKKPGPILCLTAAIHGDEINGVEIIRRLLKRTIIKKIKGSIIAVPIVNVYGFLYQDRYLVDRRDLNRSFPGSKYGSLAARLANLVTTEIFENATHFIDLHTGSFHRTNLPQIRADLDLPNIIDLANSFGAPVILHSKIRDGSLRQYMSDVGKPLLLYEAGESLRFDEFAIKLGIRGILHVMQKLNMVTNIKPTKYESAIARSSFWVRAPKSGLLKHDKSLGKHIKKDEVIAIIANPLGKEEYVVRTPMAGIIIGQTNLPLVHAGGALFHVASFEASQQVEEQIESLQSIYLSDDIITGDKF